MRRSRLYLSLSIISMVVAVGVGIAREHCGRYCPRSECNIFVNHASDARAAFDARDFAALSRHAQALTASGETLDGRRLNAYALRGQGELDEAIAAYHESMHRESGREVPRPVLIDAYIGLADCFARKGLHEPAQDWINRAKDEAVRQLARHADDGAHYQLACVFAVKSSVLEGEQAKVYRGLAIKHLRFAVRKGFDSWDHMRADIDVDALRGEPEFKALFPN